MFLDNKLFEEFEKDLVKLSTDDRKKVIEWCDQWLAKEAEANPGKWVDSFRPKLQALAKSLKFELIDGELEITCPPQDAGTLTLLKRGSGEFNGVDQLTLKLWAVIMTR